jgi:hypothetical protein
LIYTQQQSFVIRATARPLVAWSVACCAEALALSSLARALAEIKVEARAAGLTDGEIEAELDAHNAERRSRRNKPS